MRGREAHVFIAAGALWDDVVTKTPTQGVVVGRQRSLGGGTVLTVTNLIGP